MIVLTLLVIPVLIATITFILGKHRVTVQEFLCHIGAQLVIALISSAIMFSANTHDVEVFNGQISGKSQVRVSCSHSYPCNPYPCRCGKNGCSTCWRTCYRHTHDFDWRVYTNIKEQFNIQRIDSQGTKEPPRFTAVKIGEPYSSKHSYTNYVKASPDSLFRNQGAVEKYKDKLPKYPQSIYDYHRLDRTVLVGHTLKDLKGWNDKLSEVNAELGPKAEANIILLIARDVDQDYFHAVRQHWIGAKKNDIVVVMGVDQDDNISWAEIMAWSKDAMFEVVLRDHIRKVGKLDRDLIMEHIRQDTLTYFKRKSMSEYEYLKSAITPSVTQWIVMMLVGLFSSIGIAIFVYNNDITHRSYHYRRYR